MSILEGQVSASSILLQKPLPSLLVKTFIQCVFWIRPPLQHQGGPDLITRGPVLPWNLNLVLSALQRSPFEQIRDTPLDGFSCKVAILVASMSVRCVSELAALL